MSRILIDQTPSQVGETITIKGWVQTKRDHGKITFIDLRDASGVVQCVGAGELSKLSTESVVEIEGLVKERPASMVNNDLTTGGIEIEVTNHTVLNVAKELPILVEGDGREVNEEVRLEYRYLDLRRQRMQRNMQLRSNFAAAVREYLQTQGFSEVETPLLTKSTKEGARDFIVPSRFQPGKFYALPQSPQQYKQLLMTAGFEKYYQMARCIRDEDLRADRGFEHTQIDIEMSFVSQNEVTTMVQEMIIQAVTTVGGQLKTNDFPVYTYQQAMDEFGDDKFDLRSEAEKESGVLAFAWVVDFPFFKKVDSTDAAEVADGKSGWTFTHNPFSQPQEKWLEAHLAGEETDQILAAQYDLVCNGHEVGGGSIRAHDPEVVRATFKTMGYSDDQIEASVGHMLRAFELGTPPHGGIALGLDRLAMLLANEKSLKEVIAFPMTSTGRTAVMDAPSPVSEAQLAELSLEVVDDSQASPHDRIVAMLTKQGVDFEYFAHQEVITSAQAESVREDLTMKQGAKALVLAKDNKELVMAVLPGDRKLNLEKLAEYLNAKKLRLVSLDTLTAKTGLPVGAVPPFGSLWNYPTYVDAALAENERIAFNAGRRDRSIIMPYSDYLRLEKPEVVEL